MSKAVKIIAFEILFATTSLFTTELILKTDSNLLVQRVQVEFSCFFMISECD
jgi:hypothetical protein